MNSYLETSDERKCSGCLSCVYSCPTGALSIDSRFDQFSFPKLDVEKCIHCNLCQKVCPNEQDNRSEVIATYALTHQDENVLQNSSSGGAFTAISDLLMKDGYVVYGASFDESFKIHHTCAETEEGRNKMRISKYSESSLTGVFPEIKEKLDSGVKVLFTGTPCQVSGLRLFLRKPYENLCTVDLICNGVYSPKLHEDCVRLIGGDANVTNYSFRHKVNGDWASSQHILCEGENVDTRYSDAFYNFMKRRFGNRNSCTTCKFAGTARTGDFSIGDFWTVNYIDKPAFNSKGVSLVCVNTQQGQALLQRLIESGTCSIRETDLQRTLRSVPRLHTPTTQNALNQNMWKYYQKHSFKKVYGIYGANTLYSRLARKPLEYFYRFVLHR